MCFVFVCVCVRERVCVKVGGPGNLYIGMYVCNASSHLLPISHTQTLTAQYTAVLPARITISYSVRCNSTQSSRPVRLQRRRLADAMEQGALHVLNTRVAG